MPFPKIEKDFVYSKSPLREVVSKLQFPSMLRIEVEPPVKFQELVRAEFPDYTLKQPSEKHSNVSQIVSGSTLVGEPLVPPNSLAHIFESRDKLWKLVLTQKKLSLSTTKYPGWKSFRDRFEKPIAALNASYSLAPFTHSCLRYQNIIRRDRLGIPTVPWANLIQPWISGPLGSDATNDETASVINRFLINLPKGAGQVDAACGLAIEEPRRKLVFVIESHIFSNASTESGDALDLLDSLHGVALEFFRWCITDRLHEAFGPA